MRHVDRLAIALVACIGLASTLTLLAKYDWRFELLTHWRMHYFVAATLLLITYSFARRQFRIIALSAVLVVVNGSATLPKLLRRPSGAVQSAVDAQQVRVVLINVLYHNKNHQDTLAWLRELKPDIAVVVELTPEWHRSISSVNDVFPFQAAVPAGSGDGIGLFSRYPLKNPAVFWPSDGRAAVAAELNISRTTLTVVGAHPEPPTSATRTRRRDEYLVNLGQIIANVKGPTLLAGDLNTTPWSYAFEDFTRIAGLSPSGIQPSWPVGLGYAAFPIDHIMGNQGVWVFDVRSGPALGSDHLPILATIRVAPVRNGKYEAKHRNSSSTSSGL